MLFLRAWSVRGKEARMAASIMVFFDDLPDPREDQGRRHLLGDMLVIAILAVICGAEGWTDIEEFGRAKFKWLKTFLELPHGIPSHDTFGRVFARLDPDAFEACFRRWTEAVAGEIAGVVAVDGKTLRRSFDRASNQAAIHLVSAWAADHGVVFGQIATDAKSNEITAIPQLLRLLDLKGQTVTLDAMGCQKAIAEQIVGQGAATMCCRSRTTSRPCTRTCARCSAGRSVAGSGACGTRSRSRRRRTTGGSRPAGPA